MHVLDQLPVEIVTRILNNLYSLKTLYQCALINKRFYTITNPLLWHTIEINNDGMLFKFVVGLLESPHTLGRQVRGIISYNIDDATLLLLSKYLPFLEELVIHSANHISDASLQHLPRHCPNLKELNLNESTITQQTIVSLGQYSHQLTSLELDRSANLTPTIFSALVNCPLEALAIEFGDSYIECDAHTATEAALDLAVFHRLRSLTVLHSDPTLSQHIITTLHDRAGNPTWPRLDTFYLDCCDDIDETSMIAFIKTHPKLNNFGLHDNSFSDATVLDAISTFLPGVRSGSQQFH